MRLNRAGFEIVYLLLGDVPYHHFAANLQALRLECLIGADGIGSGESHIIATFLGKGNGGVLLGAGQGLAVAGELPFPRGGRPLALVGELYGYSGGNKCHVGCSGVGVGGDGKGFCEWQSFCQRC